MDTIDRPNSNVPARLAADSIRLPALVPPHELATTSSPQISPHMIVHGLARHGWRIFLLWLIVSAPIAYLIYSLVQPTYEAFSVLQVEPSPPSLFGAGGGGYVDSRDVESILQTQVEIITSDRVLNQAVAKIAHLPMIKKSDDPTVDLRKQMDIHIVSDTHLIRVALQSPNPTEAADIVNAVVDSYMTRHEELAQGRNKTLRLSLENHVLKLEGMKKEKKAKLADNVQKGNVDVKSMVNLKAAEETGDSTIQPSLSQVPVAAFGKLTETLLQIDIELNEATDLAARLAEAKTDQVGEQFRADLDARIEEAFLKDPEVKDLLGEIQEITRQLENTRRVARRPDDPAVAGAQKRLKELSQEYNNLWEWKSDELSQKLSEDSPKTIAQLNAKIDELRRKKATYLKLIDKMKVENKEKNTDALESQFLNQEIASLNGMVERIKQNVEQLDFASKQEAYRVMLIDLAVPPKTYSNNKRIKYMAAAPVGVLFLVLGLFLILEAKAERVADPDALSTRVQSEVFALPPLPTARAIRKSSPEADDQIERFIQRLDHVRFALCGDPDGLKQGRCVLITSAIGGEGKTTLAAQLAARCGNAGMSTLLIDADFRRTALCSLLDVPEGPGLSDLLKDEATLEELVIPVQGGTFHLLSAGTPVQDTSRVLQKHKFGELIGQLRQLYDLIIIDSPPVLPVPDALILGRWADGAVLAVRYDISRFPQVERARRQLDNAGIPVMGTVINGMRNSNSYYGGYSQSRRRSSQPDSSSTI